MNKISVQNPHDYVQWFIGFLVSPETEELLQKLNREIIKISEVNFVDFSPRKKSFHATVDYFTWTQDQFVNHFELISNQVKNLSQDLLQKNGINNSMNFDESFHKIWLMKSNVNSRVYLCLFPHNHASVVTKLWKKWKPHISLWYFPEEKQFDTETFLWACKQARDQILSNNHFALNLWELMHHVK